MEEQRPETNNHETLRKTAEALLRLMGFSGVSVFLRQQSPEETLTVSISTDEAGVLIGEHGANLRAFEYIIKLVARKAIPDAPRFIIDINNYREERLQELRTYARDIASRVAREGKEIVVEPMSSFERRIVHSELTSRPDIATESIGEGLERRVVVKPFI